MKRMRQGFTLLEMVVAITASSIVILAGMTIMMLCLRIQDVVYGETRRENTARVAMGLIENLADEDIKFSSDNDPSTGDTTISIKKNGADVLRYEEKSGETSGSLYAGKNVLMEDVQLKADVCGRLLTVELKDPQSGTYTASVYCRASSPKLPEMSELEWGSPTSALGEKEKNARYALLECAAAESGKTGEDFYSWFLEKPNLANSTEQEKKTWEEKKPEWKEKLPTAWCGCFASWVVWQNRDQLDATISDPTVPIDGREEVWYFAHVGRMWEKILSSGGAEGVEIISKDKVLPGDLIFFDLNQEDEEHEDEADHVGFVTEIKGEYVYTIEGNNTIEGSSGGEVTVGKSYPVESNDKILGYARLKWKTT